MTDEASAARPRVPAPARRTPHYVPPARRSRRAPARHHAPAWANSKALCVALVVMGLLVSGAVAVAAVTLHGSTATGTGCTAGTCPADQPRDRVPAGAAQPGSVACPPSAAVSGAPGGSPVAPGSSPGALAGGCAASPSTSASPSASAAPSTTAPAAPSNPKADPSGQVMPVGDLPGWRQIFTDNFATDVALGSFPSAVSSRWTGYADGAKDTSGNGTYYPSKVISVHGGLLTMNIHTENGVHLVAAPEPRLPGAGRGSGAQTYGRYAIRFRSDAIPGYKAAWLLWPNSDNWDEGEIDFPEGDLDERFQAFAHHVGDPQDSDAYSTGTTFTSWHTAIIEWAPQSITFILDGRTIGKATDSDHIPTTPFRWVLQTETQLGGGAPSSSAAGNVQIDWIAVYARA